MTYNLPKTHKRKPFIAFLLSILTPGLGQVYNGQLSKGIIFFVMLLLIPFLLRFTGVLYYFNGLIGSFLLLLLIRLYIIIDAIYIASKAKKFTPNYYNNTLYYLGLFIAMIGINMIFPVRAILKAESFTISTPSMSPTLQPGDFLMADMDFDKQSIDYGDLVIFKAKEDGELYICRIAGLPNDSIQLKDNFLIINGQPTRRSFIKDLIIGDIETSVFQETFPNQKTIKHYQYLNRQRQPNTTPIKIPEKAYYLVGDNRDGCLDSRYRGSIAQDQIVGKLLYTYWGATNDRIGVSLK